MINPEKGKKNQIMEEKKQMTEAQINTVKNNIATLNREISAMQDESKKLEEEIKQLDKDIATKKEEIKKVMNYYQLSSGENEYLEYVFEAADFTDFIYRMAIAEQLSSYNDKLVDEYSAKLLSKYCTMTDLLNRGVFSVESIYQVRQNFQLYQGLYFISPTIKSCEALAKDYEDKKNYRYKKIHIFFTHKASEECLKALVNEGVINRTVTCSEFNLSFFPVNKNGFDLQLESGLKIFKCEDTMKDIKDKLEQIETLRMGREASPRTIHFIFKNILKIYF